MQVDYNECLRFIERHLGLKLSDYQKIILQAVCEGKKVRASRGIKRSTVARACARYIEYLLDENDYKQDPDVTFRYHCAVENELMSQGTVDEVHKRNTKIFEKEFECK